MKDKSSQVDHEPMVTTINVSLRTCRVCGCDDLHACPGGCYWVEENLCSQCAEAEAQLSKLINEMYPDPHLRGLLSRYIEAVTPNPRHRLQLLHLLNQSEAENKAAFEVYKSMQLSQEKIHGRCANSVLLDDCIPILYGVDLSSGSDYTAIRRVWVHKGMTRGFCRRLRRNFRRFVDWLVDSAAGTMKL